jgi:hypothetical protein
MGLLDSLFGGSFIESHTRPTPFSATGGMPAALPPSRPASAPTPAMPVPPSAPATQPSFFERLGSGVKDYLSDPENRARLAAGFNTMRLNPDPNIARMAQSQIETSQQMRLLKQQGNQTAIALETAAARESNPARKKQLEDAAVLVRNQPEMAVAASKLLFKTATPQSYAPRVDPQTGQLYITQYDPTTGSVSRVDVPGAIGETPAQQSERELKAETRAVDIENAVAAGTAAFSQVQNIDTTIGRLESALDALDNGAQSGALRQYIPSFDAATSSLRATANQMGIDIVNSATFGALSASELKLALDTGLPLELPPNQLRKYIAEKIAAQTKLRNQLFSTAQRLSSGKIPYSDFIKQYKPKGGTEVFRGVGGGGIQRPPSITEEEWNAMTQEQRNLFK